MIPSRKKAPKKYNPTTSSTPFMAILLDKPLDTFIQLLHDANIDVNATTVNGETLIHRATRYKRFKILDYLSTHDDINVNAVDFQGDTPLHLAANINNGSKAVQMLLKAKANPNSQNSTSNDTPLHRAVTGRNVNAAIFLIRYGADPLIKNKDGLYPHQLKAPSVSSSIIEPSQNLLLKRVITPLKKAFREVRHSTSKANMLHLIKEYVSYHVNWLRFAYDDQDEHASELPTLCRSKDIPDDLLHIIAQKLLKDPKLYLFQALWQAYPSAQVSLPFYPIDMFSIRGLHADAQALLLKSKQLGCIPSRKEKQNSPTSNVSSDLYMNLEPTPKKKRTAKP